MSPDAKLELQWAVNQLSLMTKREVEKTGLAEDSLELCFKMKSKFEALAFAAARCVSLANERLRAESLAQ